MPAVRSPEAFLGRGDRDHRVEEHPGAVQDVGELAVVGLRKIALEGRGLDRVDGEDRDDERVFPEWIAVRAEHEPARAFDPAARFLGLPRERIEPALRGPEAARFSSRLARRAAGGGALDSGSGPGSGRAGHRWAL